MLHADAMNQIERRKAERRTEEDELSPEYLALLEVCGGEIRASDRELLANRRQSAEAVPAGPSAVAGPEGAKSSGRQPEDRRVKG